jgi:uncharacterized membrane protein YvbJ
MKKKSKHKYCPVCGVQLLIKDTYCVKCGYSFEERKKKKKKIKWKNIIFIGLILLVFYFSLRYFNGQSIIPESFLDALDFSWGNKG